MPGVLHLKFADVLTWSKLNLSFTSDYFYFIFILSSITCIVSKQSISASTALWFNWKLLFFLWLLNNSSIHSSESNSFAYEKISHLLLQLWKNCIYSLLHYNFSSCAFSNYLLGQKHYCLLLLKWKIKLDFW